MSKDESILKNFVIGAMAGCTAVTFSNPFDCAKTKLQIQGELRKSGEYRKAFKGVVDTIVKTYQHEGISSVQRGLLTVYCFQVVMNGTRLGLYETFKKLRSKESQTNPLINFFTAAFSGFAGGVFATPLQLIKTRQQSSSFAAERFKYEYTGLFDAWKKITDADGARGLFRGCSAFGSRTAIGGATQLASYDSLKHLAVDYFGLADDLKLYIGSSLLATFACCVAMNPLDVIATRVFNQNYSKSAGGALYKGPIDCIVKTVRVEGFFGLYKGFDAMCWRTAPHSMIFLLVSEFLKQRLSKY